jgi:hypothetical protein
VQGTLRLLLETHCETAAALPPGDSSHLAAQRGSVTGPEETAQLPARRVTSGYAGQVGGGVIEAPHNGVAVHEGDGQRQVFEDSLVQARLSLAG